MADWCGRRPFDWSAMARMRRIVFRRRFWKPSRSRAGSRCAIGPRCCGIWRRFGRSTCCESAADIAAGWMQRPVRMRAVSREANPVQEAEASELAERLRAALPHLSQDQAAVFCLSCLENLSYQEIGERLGMTANAVGVMLHRARHRLRELLISVDTGSRRRRLRITHVEDRQNKATGDLLDRATEACGRVPVPPGPPPEAVRRALDAGLEVHVVPLSVKKSARAAREFAESSGSPLPRRFLRPWEFSSPGL